MYSRFQAFRKIIVLKEDAGWEKAEYLKAPE